MSWLRIAWTTASRTQKLVIVIALLVSLGALPNLVGPTQPALPSQPPAAHVGPLPAGVDVGRSAEAPSAALSSASPSNSPLLPATASPSPSATPRPTPVRTPSPTPTPQRTATPAPRRTATPAPTARTTPRPTTSLSLAFRSLTSPVHRGSDATASVHTTSGARCDIDVEYKSGSSTAAGLVPKTADGAGNVSWTWKVGTRTTPGAWPVTVSCSKSGQTRTVTKDFQVI